MPHSSPARRIAALLVFASCLAISLQAAAPLRIFIRAGVKTHGPGQHDHPRFLQDWKDLLGQRGARADGAMDFPSSAQLEASDVLVMFAQDAANIKPEQRAGLAAFLKRGGGIVVLHDAVCGRDADWFKTVVGGAWQYGKAKWFEGDIQVRIVDHDHPITRGLPDFAFKDEIYYNLDMLPDARVLAVSSRGDFKDQPQLWTFEKDNYRAFVCIQGHEYDSFQMPWFRTIVLRGIAWAGKLDPDAFVTKAELEAAAKAPAK